VLIACPATLHVGLFLDRGRSHVGRPDDLLELEAVLDGAAPVDAEGERADAEGDQHDRCDEPADFECLAHDLRSLPRLPISCGQCRGWGELRRPGFAEWLLRVSRR
jgi:hypothetical protein